jgi:hypothetical protein
LAPWADCLYACDHRWFATRGPTFEQFRGARVQGHIAPKGQILPGCIHGGVVASTSKMFFDGARIAAGGNSGFQAVNFAARCGVSRIILLGFDMGFGAEPHWHGWHGKGLSNPEPSFLKRCAAILDSQYPVLSARGIQVLNASRETNLKRIPRVSIEAAFSQGEK